MRHALFVWATAAAVLVAQDVQIRPRLVAGDEFRLEVLRVREDAARPQASYTGRTPVQVRVLKAGKAGFVLSWRPGVSTLEGAAAGDPGVALASRALGEVEFRVALDADGDYSHLENETEIRPRLEAARDAALKWAAAGASTDDQMKTAALAKQILSPANLISIATRDVQTYVAMHGVELAVGETLEMPLDQPSPLGGGTLPATFRVRMDSASAATATLSTTMVYDPEGLKKMTLQIAGQVGAKPTDEELAKYRLTISDDGKYVFDRKVGLMREVTVNRRVAAGPAGRLDRWVIRLVSDPRR